jgi:hypothetical protein
VYFLVGFKKMEYFNLRKLGDQLIPFEPGGKNGSFSGWILFGTQIMMGLTLIPFRLLEHTMAVYQVVREILMRHNDGETMWTKDRYRDNMQTSCSAGRLACNLNHTVYHQKVMVISLDKETTLLQSILFHYRL